MIWPRLTGSNVVDLIRNWRDLWNNQLSEKLRSLEITAGPGVRIDKRPMGQVISVTLQPGGSAPQSSTPGLFQVTLEAEDKLTISGGWVNRNGLAVTWYEGETIDITAAGTVCICSEPVDKLGNWSPVRARIVPAPTTSDAPIGKIDKLDGFFVVTQYPVTTAYILRAKRCPIAEL